MQNCEDMFVLSKWNQSKTYSFEIKRDFGTDYGICCWYTPQLNFTEIDRYFNATDVEKGLNLYKMLHRHTRENHLHEPDWGQWFMNVPKVISHRHFFTNMFYAM